MSESDEDDAITRVMVVGLEGREEEAPTVVFERPPAPAALLPSLSYKPRSWWDALISFFGFWFRALVAAFFDASPLRREPQEPLRAPVQAPHVRVSAPKAMRGPIATLISSLSSGQRALVDEVHTLLWGLDLHELGETARLIEYIVAARRAGPEARVEAQILHALTYILPEEDGAVGLALLRGKLLGVVRSAVDHALLRLEEQGHLVLLHAAPVSGARQPSAALAHPARGPLERVALTTRVQRAS